MAARRRVVKVPKPEKKREVVEGEVTVCTDNGVVVWDFIPTEEDHPTIPAHGIAVGGLIDATYAGRRVRITIEEL